MRLTARQLNRATLHRQLLLRRAPLDTLEAVRRVVAIQAQEPASPYIALWGRVAGFDPSTLDAAFADGSIVKASLMRITLHAVLGTDYPAFHEAMQSTLRASRLHDRRFAASGLTIEQADGLVDAVLAHAGEPRSNAAMEALLAGQPPGPNGTAAWWALRTYAPVRHAPTGGPWAFGPRPSYVASGSPRPGMDRAAALQRLVVRYLEGFGPAAIADIAQFALLRRPIVREAVEALGERLVRREGPDGADLLDVPDGIVPDEDVPAPPRLLAMWDSILLAYADRGRIIPADLRRRLIQRNGDVLPAVLVDGAVAGVWRPVEGGIEVSAFHRLDDDAWAGLADEARALRTFLAGREPLAYRRYGRWWTSVGAPQVRVLG